MKKLLFIGLVIGCFMNGNAQWNTNWNTHGNCAPGYGQGDPLPSRLLMGTKSYGECLTNGQEIGWVYDFDIIHADETMASFEEDLITLAPASAQKVLVGDAPTNTSTYDYKLYVEKGILTEMVKVAIKSTSDWSDHVFYDAYQLMPLAEVEGFINQYGHLPNVPSAEKLVKEGLDLGEMQAKQMEKIEELTLYLIEKDKEIKMLQEQVEQLSKQMKLLLEKEQ